MLIDIFLKLISQDFWISVFDNVEGFRWLFGILLPAIEAVFPPLPLTVFVTINVMVFGFWLGFIYSYFGTCIGSTLAFLILKAINDRILKKWVDKNKKAVNIINWIKKKGIYPIFVLMCFPFTPSSLIITIAALSGITFKKFFPILIIGKLIMVLALNFIGYNISSFTEKPIISVIMIVAISAALFIAKKVLNFIESKYVLI